MRVKRNIPEIVLGALLTVAVFAMGAVVSYSIQAPINQPQQAKTEQKSNDGTVPVIASKPDPNERIADYTLALVILTVVMAVATAGLWIIGIRTARRQLRAYVFVEAHAPERDVERPVINPRGQTRIPLQVWNRGQTPAYGVRAWVRTHILPNPLGNTQIQKEPPPGLVFHPTDLGPGAHTIVDGLIGQPWGDATHQAVLNGTMRIYLYGKVWYRDAFKRDQWVEFRMMVPVNQNGGFTGVQVASEGNKAT